MPRVDKAKKRDNKRRKQRYGHTGGGRGYLHILDRKNKERESLKKGRKKK